MCTPLLEKAGEDLDKEDTSAAETAQEQLCNSRDRHDKDFQEMQETIFSVKDTQRCAEVAQEQVDDSRNRCDRNW